MKGAIKMHPMHQPCRQVDVSQLMAELTMSEVDRLSEMLGKLAAESEESRRQRATLYEKIDKMEREHVEMQLLMRRHMRDFQDHSELEMRRFDELIQPTLNDYKKMKNRAIGVASVIAILGGIIWELVKRFSHKLGF